MKHLIQLLLAHGYLLLFFVVLGQQSGVPVPSDPLMLAMGTLAGAGHFSLVISIFTAATGALIGDLLWFELGRQRGRSVLKFLCRLSLEPDSCVRHTEAVFRRRGPRALILSKFVPGLSTVATPMAGLIGMSRRQFLLWDGMGVFLWVGTYLGAGFVFRAQLERLAALAAAAGTSLASVVVVAFLGYLIWKITQRQLTLRRLRGARISAEELRNALENGEEFTIIDLRQEGEIRKELEKIPGAIHLLPDQLTVPPAYLEKNRAAVLYCT